MAALTILRQSKNRKQVGSVFSFDHIVMMKGRYANSNRGNSSLDGKLTLSQTGLCYFLPGVILAAPVGHSELCSPRYRIGTVGPSYHLRSKHLWLPAIWIHPVLISCLLLWSNILAKSNLWNKWFIWVTIPDYWMEGKARIQVANHIITTVRSKEK